jgi:hypothetical protein
MDFSIKALADISTLMAEEIGKQIELGSIQDLKALENGIRAMLKAVGQQTYQKVLESEDGKQGKQMACSCKGQAQRISKIDNWADRGNGLARPGQIHPNRPPWLPPHQNHGPSGIH